MVSSSFFSLQADVDNLQGLGRDRPLERNEFAHGVSLASRYCYSYGHELFGRRCGNFDINLNHCSRIPQPCHPTRASCCTMYFTPVPVLIGC